MKFRFDEANHLYYLDNNLLNGVTTVLEDQGLYRHLRGDRERFFLLGRYTDEACDLYDEGVLDIESLPDEYRGNVEAYILFRQETDFVFFPGFEKAEDRRIYSEKHLFAGTPDMPGNFEGFKSIIDRKRSEGGLKATSLQTAAYKIAIEERFPDIKIVKRGGLYLKNNGKYNLEWYENKSDVNVFLGMNVAYHWKKIHGFVKEKGVFL